MIQEKRKLRQKRNHISVIQRTLTKKRIAEEWEAVVLGEKWERGTAAIVPLCFFLDWTADWRHVERARVGGSRFPN